MGVKLWDVVFVGGLVSVVSGVWMISVPAALIVAGLACVSLGIIAGLRQ